MTKFDLVQITHNPIDRRVMWGGGEKNLGGIN